MPEAKQKPIRTRSRAEIAAAETELAKDIASFRHNLSDYVKYNFQWGKGDLERHGGPDKWQSDLYAYIDKCLATNPYEPIRIAIKAGHGVGKSASVAHIIKWAMDTCVDTKIVVTANTQNQLMQKTSPELAKWHRNSLTKSWCDCTATMLKSNAKGHEATWRCDFTPWSKTNTEAFAGLHNEGRRIVVIFDESGGIDDPIWDVVEGVNDANTEIIHLRLGNPTRNTGRFRECFGAMAHRWHGVTVDSRSSKFTNHAELQKMIDDEGEDSDMVRVRIKGEFPRSASNQLISGEDIDTCMNRIGNPLQYQHASIVLGVDIARFGLDRTCIMLRQGRYASILHTLRGNDLMQVTGAIVSAIREHKPQLVFLDGVGLGAGPFDRLIELGYKNIVCVDNKMLANAQDKNRYKDLRVEMWDRMRKWIEGESILPKNPELKADLENIQCYYTSTGIMYLESKDQMKARGLASPDLADALALTFAQEYVAKEDITLDESKFYIGRQIVAENESYNYCAIA